MDSKLEYYTCRNHGKLPIENFYSYDLKATRKQCKNCSKEQKIKRNEIFFKKRDPNVYAKAKGIRRDFKSKRMDQALKNITQDYLYRTIIRFEGTCALTGTKRGCTIARWKHSSWTQRNIIFTCKAYAQALEMAHELRDKTGIQKKCITQMTRQALQKQISKEKNNIDTHFAPWILNQILETDEMLDTISDVPSLIFSDDAVKKIDNLINNTS